MYYYICIYYFYIIILFRQFVETFVTGLDIAARRKICQANVREGEGLLTTVRADGTHIRVSGKGTSAPLSEFKSRYSDLFISSFIVAEKLEPRIKLVKIMCALI